MNILDIIMAKKMATQDTSEVVNKVTKVAEQAQIVANEAEQTLQEANTAVENANSTNETTQQMVEQAQNLVENAQSTLDTLAETVNTADEAVQKVAAIEEQATAAAEKAQAASDSFDTMKEDLLTAAEGLVDEAVVEVVNRELTNLNDHMDQVDTTVKGFESTVASYDEKINYLTDTLPEVNAAAFEADKAARAAQATADDAKQIAHDANLLAQTLDTTTGILGAQLTSVANKVDSVEEGVSNLQTQQSATDLKVETLETNVGEIENTVDEVEATVNELKSNTLDVTLEDQSDEAADIQELTITKGKTKKSRKFKTYKKINTSEDGAVTPKAAKDYIDNVKTDLEKKISEIPSGGGGISNLGPENAGKTVFVGEDGNITAGSITEDELVKMATVMGMYQSDDTVGIEIDYVNKTYSRLQGAMSLIPGNDFNQFEMLGGRRRCIVDDNGQIVAFEGEMGYNEDGSVGQVMIYQPKVYYLRTPLSTTANSSGISITKEQILLTGIKTQGFKLHPLFVNSRGEEVDYVFLPAYEGSVYKASTESYIKDDSADVDYDSDMLSSVIDAKPASSITPSNFKKLAMNRGENWTLTNAKAESLNQLLMMVEYGTLNLQNSLGRGICDLDNSTSKNISLITGSTSSLGSSSGAATSSKDENETSYTESGKVAVSYRGFENPYGNMWRVVDDTTIVGSGNANGGTPTISGTPTSYNMPNSSDWISCFAQDQTYDWLMIPGAIRLSANSSLPVGDYCYVTPGLNKTNSLLVGGKASSGDYAGPFAYFGALGTDIQEKSVNARIMYVPARNEIYQANCEKWKALIGG